MDYRAALICAVLANIHRNPKRRHKPFVPQDFMPGKGKAKSQKQTPDEMLEVAKAISGGMEEPVEYTIPAELTDGKSIEEITKIVVAHNAKLKELSDG